MEDARNRRAAAAASSGDQLMSTPVARIEGGESRAAAEQRLPDEEFVRWPSRLAIIQAKGPKGYSAHDPSILTRGGVTSAKLLKRLIDSGWSAKTAEERGDQPDCRQLVVYINECLGGWSTP